MSGPFYMCCQIAHQRGTKTLTWKQQESFASAVTDVRKKSEKASSKFLS